jgi:hypothetical protein
MASNSALTDSRTKAKEDLDVIGFEFDKSNIAEFTEIPQAWSRLRIL